jgi:CRISPR-associated protein Csd1
MLAAALAQYADERLQDELADAAFEEKPVAFLLELAADGRFLSLRPRAVAQQRGKKQVMINPPLRVPKSPVARVSGLHPLLGADDLKYVLGAGSWTKEKEKANHEERFAAFVALIGRAEEATGDPALKAVSAFYSHPDQVEAAREAAAREGAIPGQLIALSVDGPIIERDVLRQYWSCHYAAAFGARMQTGATGMCLISGNFGPVAPTHDKIKGLGNLGGLAAGVALMSFDKQAFRSYGWEQNANSPVAPDRAAAYILALNHLLRPESKARRVHGGVAYLFWTRAGQEDTLMSLIENADARQVERLLQWGSEGLDLKPDDFYFLGVSGNGGRLLVRDWLHDSLDSVLGNVRRWFTDLQIIDVFSGEFAPPPPFWKLLQCLCGPGEDDVPAPLSTQLLRRVLRGQPVKYGLLSRLLTRLRRAQGSERLRPERVALLRLSCNEVLPKGEQMSAELDPELENRAYLCGQLLAVYDGLQYAAQENVNVTVADRFYSLASTHPQLAFPKIADLGEKHLRKLRRDNRGAMVAIQRNIAGLMERIGKDDCKFPGALTLAEQGSFVLGYHHKKAQSMQQAQARKQAKQDMPQSEQENTNE